MQAFYFQTSTNKVVTNINANDNFNHTVCYWTQRKTYVGYTWSGGYN